MVRQQARSRSQLVVQPHRRALGAVLTWRRAVARLQVACKCVPERALPLTVVTLASLPVPVAAPTRQLVQCACKPAEIWKLLVVSVRLAVLSLCAVAVQLQHQAET